jgi:glycosyltransferase involved in cell wall biosynthesis
VGGIPEAVAKDISGYLVPPGDPEAFAQALNRISRLSPEDRLTMGQAGLERVRQIFEAESIIDKWERVYLRILGAAHRVSAQTTSQGIPAVVS